MNDATTPEVEANPVAEVDQLVEDHNWVIQRKDTGLLFQGRQADENHKKKKIRLRWGQSDPMIWKDKRHAESEAYQMLKEGGLEVNILDAVIG